jgi:23S rRNA pseudouridine2604 synthase
VTRRLTYAGPEPVRLNKWLAQSGVVSRRAADGLIADGRVRINGSVVNDAGRRVQAADVVEIDGAEEAGATWVLNKPVGFVSAQPEYDQVPAARLLNAHQRFGTTGDPPGRDASLAPLGRLDQDSRGLLLLSTDGVLAKAVIGPASRLDKEYLVRARGPLDARGLGLLRHGLELDGRRLKTAQVSIVEDGVLRFVLTEGRKRQIRRMCAAISLEVLDLQRVRIGPLRLGELPEGRWRVLSAEERAALLAAS